jgi:hypothetical protein
MGQQDRLRYHQHRQHDLGWLACGLATP